MTRATYNTDNTLTELPGMKPPYYYDAWLLCKKINKFLLLTSDQIRPIEEYNAHLSSLRTIPCSPECRGLWKPGDQLEEGKDYEVKGAGEWKWCYQLKGNIFASPITVNEDDLWDEVMGHIFTPNPDDVYNSDLITFLKSKYSLTKR